MIGSAARYVGPTPVSRLSRLGRLGVDSRAVALRVTIYGRDGCHLCDEARVAILALAEERGRSSCARSTSRADDRLLAAYLERIPVVEVEGREVSELEFDADALRRALHTVGP